MTVWAGGPVWADRPSGTKAIRTCRFDRTGVANLHAGATDPRGVAVDTRGGRVYYLDRLSGANTGELNSIPLMGGVPVQHLSSLSRPADLRLDAAGRRLFWCEETGGTIRQAAIPGDASGFLPQTLFSGLASPYYLDIDFSRGKIFWGTSGNSLYSGPVAGGTPDPVLYTGGQNMRGVCVDEAAGMIYWVERDGPRAIRRRPISGGPVEDLFTGLDTPHGLVLDVAARKLYWVDTGTQNAGGFNARGVSRGDMNGAAAGLPEVVVAGTSANQPWDIDLDLRVSTYQEWVARYFRYDEPASRTARTADPDGDGQSNFMEYAFGTPPLSGSGESVNVKPGLLPPPYAANEGVVFRKRASATDLDYVVQLSWTGTSWVTALQGDWLYSTMDGEVDSEGMCWSRSGLVPEAVGEIGTDPRIFRVKVTERAFD